MQLQSADLGAILVSLGLVQSSSKPQPLPYTGTTFSELSQSSSHLPVVGVVNFQQQDVVRTSSSPSCAAVSYESPPVNILDFPPFDKTKANVYRYRQQQSVNLGSWFVQELWMVPSLFECAAEPRLSEIDVASGWGGIESARMVLERHWDTFITKNDFQYLQSIGINTVRLPVGYWNLGPLFCMSTPFEAVGEVYLNSWPRIVRAIQWAAEYGIGVIVDMHGAYGSQNGQPHSGTSDSEPHLFSQDGNMERTMQALAFLTEELAPVTNIVGIQLLNEPIDDPKLVDFYTRAIDALRNISPEARILPFYIHDGFVLSKFVDFVAARTDFVVVDHHSYFVFTPRDAARPATSHTSDIKSEISDQLEAASQKARNNLVVGEWSCGLTDDSLAQENNRNDARREFCEGQMQVYANRTAGWVFWSYKKEGCDDDQGWCFRQAVGTSLPRTFFSYSGQSSAEDQITEWNVEMSVDNVSPQLTDTGSNTIAADQPARLVRPLHVQRSFYRCHHRAHSIHQRRRHKIRNAGTGLNRRQAVSVEARGYGDGFQTTNIFARYGMSRLGFKGQYILDTLAVLGSDMIPSNMESVYTESFLKGLHDAEKQVEARLSNNLGG